MEKKILKTKHEVQVIKTEQIKEKKEINTAVPLPDGFILTKLLQDYEGRKKGEEIILVERRYKSLKRDNIVL